MAVLEDRVPGKPGRVLVTPEDGGEAFYATLELADEPVVAGNKVNRQNVIDTLLPVSNDGGVGTVIYTTVPEPDDRWLLCDGSDVTESAGEELRGRLTTMPVQEQALRLYPMVNSSGVALGMKVNSVRYVNGYYVASGYASSANTPDGSYGACIAYSRDLVTWTLVNIVQGVKVSSYLHQAGAIAYGNGYYAVAVDKYESSSYGTEELYIYYATSLDGPWTGVEVNTIGYTNYLDIKFMNGQFVVIQSKWPGGNQYYYYGLTHMYAAETPDGTWSDWSSTSDAVADVWYNEDKGRYEMISVNTDANDDDDDDTYECYVQVKFWTASAVTGNWTSKKTWTSDLYQSGTTAINYNPDGLINGIVRDPGGGGIWVAVAPQYLLYYDYTTNTWTVKRKKATSLSGADRSEALICDGSVLVYYDGETELHKAVDAADWVARTDEVVLLLNTQDGRVVWYDKTPDGALLLPYTGNKVLVLDSYMRYFLPDITVPDANGLVQAYIKAK